MQIPKRKADELNHVTIVPPRAPGLSRQPAHHLDGIPSRGEKRKAVTFEAPATRKPVESASTSRRPDTRVEPDCADSTWSPAAQPVRLPTFSANGEDEVPADEHADRSGPIKEPPRDVDMVREGARMRTRYRRKSADPTEHTLPPEPTPQEIAQFEDQLNSEMFGATMASLRPIENTHAKPHPPIRASVQPMSPVVTQLSRVSATLQPILVRDDHFRAVLSTVRLNQRIAGNNIERYLNRAGLNIERRSENQILCSPTLKLKNHEQVAQKLAELNGTEIKEMTMQEIEEFLLEYAQMASRDEDDVESYVGIMGDHMRFLFDIELVDARRDEYVFTNWSADFI